ncbi:unnamed protein product [Diamesa hyperborea]
MALECLICFHRLLARENNTFSTNCGHVYHKACIEDWVNQNQTCPHCRKPNPVLFQIFLDHNESDNHDSNDSSSKLQTELLLTRISDLDNRMKENNEKFDELYTMIEQLTISVSSFEANNQKLQRENDNLEQLLEAKTLQDSQRQFDTYMRNGTDSKENDCGMNSIIMPLVSSLKL